MTTNAMMSKKKMPDKAPKKTAGKRVPQHNEPKAKAPKHDGVPMAMRRATPTEGPAYKTAGHNVGGAMKKMAGAKKRSK